MITYGWNAIVEYICSLTNDRLFERSDESSHFSIVILFYKIYKVKQDISINVFSGMSDPFLD